MKQRIKLKKFDGQKLENKLWSNIDRIAADKDLFVRNQLKFLTNKFIIARGKDYSSDDTNDILGEIVKCGYKGGQILVTLKPPLKKKTQFTLNYLSGLFIDEQ